MKTKKTITAILVMISMVSHVLAQGSLTPPGAPAPTMKTLEQIEPRTIITNLPYTISQSGSYCVSGNLNGTGGQEGITVTAGNVTIDLGGGFENGIKATVPASSRNIRVTDISVSGCLVNGISGADIVESCSVANAGEAGIQYAEVVSKCQVFQCGLNGIDAITASDCYGEAIFLKGISASTAINCRGFSTYGTGCSATSAQNCSGQSTNGKGLGAWTAQNCDGRSENGSGLDAEIANTCYGFSQYGTGLVAKVANSCEGYTTYGTASSITHKYNMP